MQIVQASDFGVTPGEVSVELVALTDHIESLGGGCVVVFEPGAYTIDKRITVHYGDTDGSGRRGRDQHCIVLRSVSDVFLAMDGTDWQIVGGYTTHYETPAILGGTQWLWPPGFLFFRDCDNCHAWGFTADGGSETITRGLNEQGSLHTELGNHGLCFHGSRNCVAHHFTVRNFCCDGVIADNWPSSTGEFQHAVDCRVYDFTVDGCMRNGITAADSQRFTATNGQVLNTGTSASYVSHSPVCGIDVEADTNPDPGDPSRPNEFAGGHAFRKIHVEGPDALRTFVAFWEKNRGVLVEDCTFIGNPNEAGFSFFVMSPMSVIRRCTIRAQLPTVGALDGWHTICEDSTFELEFFSSPFGWLSIGDNGRTGRVTFTGNQVVAGDSSRAAHIYAPNSTIRNNRFRSTLETQSNWIATVSSQAVGTVIDSNEFTTERPSAQVLTRGADTNSILGAGVTVK